MAIKGKGSFRGIPFYTVDHDTTGGRRQPTYSIPYQDDGARMIDLGREPRKYRITGYIAGDSFRQDANSMLAAFEQEGPGILVHPVYGRVTVSVGKNFSLKESTLKLRVIDISFECTEVSSSEKNVPPPDTAGALRASVVKSKAISASVFANPVTGLKQPAISDFVQAAHLDCLDSVIAQLRRTNGAVASVTSIPEGFASQINQIGTELETLIQTPSLLHESMLGAFENVTATVNRLIDTDGVERNVANIEAAKALVSRTADSNGSLLSMVDPFSVIGDSAQIPDINTPARDEQRQGQNAIQLAMRSAGLLSLAGAVLDARFDSSNDVRRVRDKLAQALRDLADGDLEPDVQLSVALKDTAAKLLSHMTKLAGTLAEIGQVTPAITIPVEVLAWGLYGDAERSEEIVLYNRGVITNPSAIGGRQTLEVKTR